MQKLAFFLLLAATLLAYNCQDNTYSQGEVYYQYYCANCHMDDGVGLRGNIPPLANADYVQQNPLEMACIIRNGLEGEIVVNGQTYNNPMPGFPELKRDEITNIINYINHAWGNDYGFINPIKVREELEKCTKE